MTVLRCGTDNAAFQSLYEHCGHSLALFCLAPSGVEHLHLPTCHGDAERTVYCPDRFSLDAFEIQLFKIIPSCYSFRQSALIQ